MTENLGDRVEGRVVNGLSPMERNWMSVGRFLYRFRPKGREVNSRDPWGG
ncbi:MAG: hypothetical protein P8020_03005 [Acidobacteriota bacterium]